MGKMGKMEVNCFLIILLTICFPFQVFGCWIVNSTLYYPASKQFGNHQSPINLIEGNNTMPKRIPNLIFSNYNGVPTSARLVNGGHTLEFKADWPTGRVPTISGGALPGRYVFDSLHFHWGSENCCGSEHLLQNKQYSMEMHVVHVLPGLTKEELLATPNSIVVVGYTISSADSSNFKLITDYMGGVLQPNTAVEISPFSLRKIMPAVQEYFTYPGSLTVSPYPEIVIWIVSKSQLSITTTEIEKFRTINDEHHELLLNTARKVQTLSDRTLYSVWSNKIVSYP